jgi:hypothetical protein
MKLLLSFLFSILLINGTLIAQDAERYSDRTSMAARGTARETTAVRLQTQHIPASSVGEIYPNPVSNKAELYLNLNQPGKVTFYNVLGTRVASYDFAKENKTFEIDFKDFSEGVYFGVVQTAGKNIATRRIVVRH